MQGFNMGRYYPPSEDALPRFNTNSSLRVATRRNASTGSQTIRFEMPFHIWCNTCKDPTIIPQGVRFNAEKKKIGMYYSTPIWSFRIKHTTCGGWIEIRTDPAAGEYIVFEGGKRRDYGKDNDNDAVLGEEERERRRNDAFAALEGNIEDRKRGKEDGDRIKDLREWRERDWADPYETSRRVRKGFREERKARERKEADIEALKDKYSLDIDLLDENETDRARAELVDFGSALEGENVTRRPLFPHKDHETSLNIGSVAKRGMTRAQKEAVLTRTKLTRELKESTRAAIDPFLLDKPRTSIAKPLLGIKRKREEAQPLPMGSTNECKARSHQSRSSVVTRPIQTTSLELVGYDSD